MIKDLLTEGDSGYDHLEKMEIDELVAHINAEDKKVALAIEYALPQIAALVKAVVATFNHGGRLFYLGAGTSGRLGILDASECPPTFGTPHEMVVGLIAGGDTAIRRAVEGAEDDTQQGFKDLEQHQINVNDIVIGISASGRTPYVEHALRKCREKHIETGCIVCNADSVIAAQSDYPVEVPVGPEFVTGSTRMKAGTAQKMVLNMVTTAAMINIGRVEGNKMVHMKLSNKKLMDRGVRIVSEKTGLSAAKSKALLKKHNYNISDALDDFRNATMPD